MAIQESEYDEFSAPIPGQSLTDEPQNYPWEQPPRYTDFEEIAELTMAKIFSKKNTKNIIMMLEAGIPVEGVARSIVFGGFLEGQYSVDIALLLTKVVFEAVMTIAGVAKVDDLRLTVNNDDEIQNDFEVSMADSKFRRELEKRTETDLKEIKQQTPKEVEPTMGLMTRPSEGDNE